eukprot:654182-Prymnesium_polylepis.1
MTFAELHDVSAWWKPFGRVSDSTRTSCHSHTAPPQQGARVAPATATRRTISQPGHRRARVAPATATRRIIRHRPPYPIGHSRFPRESDVAVSTPPGQTGAPKL